MNTQTIFAAAALMAVGALTPQAAMAQSHRDERKADKSLMAAVGLGLGIAALDKLRKGDTGAALLLGAGAAYAGKKFEDQRQKLSDRYGRNDRYDDRFDGRQDARYDDRFDVRYDDRQDARYDERRDSRSDRDRYERDDRWQRDQDSRWDDRRSSRAQPKRRSGCDLTGPGRGRSYR